VNFAPDTVLRLKKVRGEIRTTNKQTEREIRASKTMGRGKAAKGIMIVQ
jgi:hypothetical protein